MYVCMYVHMYVCTYVCMYICVCIYICMYVCTYVCTYVVYMYVYVCMYVCMYTCMYVWMYVCNYVCCIYVCHICQSVLLPSTGLSGLILLIFGNGAISGWRCLLAWSYSGGKETLIILNCASKPPGEEIMEIWF